MSTYLDLVNKVIDESGLELDQLTLITWSSAEAGRRVYPRIKRLVAEAWKLIQMERNQWEFKSAELHTTVYARIKFDNGLRAAGAPPVGSVFVGATSEFQFTVRQVFTEEGDWIAGTATGMLEFEVFTGSALVQGETFNEQSPILNDGEFRYLEKGWYDFNDQVADRIQSYDWTSFVAYRSESTPVPVVYLPWDNWTYEEASFTQGSLSPPAYFSQDPRGNIVFYPQTLDPFTLNFYYVSEPSSLVDPDDVPDMPAIYHDWIAWNALANLAAYDKNPDLFSYAQRMAAPYKLAGERNLMPLLSWGNNKFNRRDYP